MKNILILISLFSVSFGVLSAHHEKDESSKVMQGNNFAYLSSYTIPAGANPSSLQKSLIKNIESQFFIPNNECLSLHSVFLQTQY